MCEKNITRVQLNGKEYILIGTAHVSKQSAEHLLLDFRLLDRAERKYKAGLTRRYRQPGQRAV